MRLSLLQPEIVRGNIERNATVIQRLIDQSYGELLVLPEYALTGSLTLDAGADVWDWTRRSNRAKAGLKVPEGKYLLINTLDEADEGKLYNCCELLPSQECQYKLFPDQTEQDAGIIPGIVQQVFLVDNTRFQAVICTDLRHAEEILTHSLDFILFIFHFTADNITQAMQDLKAISKARNLRIFVSSLVSDQNIGLSSFIHKDIVVSLPRKEGILEVEIE